MKFYSLSKESLELMQDLVIEQTNRIRSIWTDKSSKIYSFLEQSTYCMKTEEVPNNPKIKILYSLSQKQDIALFFLKLSA